MRYPDIERKWKKVMCHQEEDFLPVEGRGAEAASVAVDFWMVGSSTTFAGLVVTVDDCWVLVSVFFVVFESS